MCIRDRLSALAYTTGLGYRPTCDLLFFRVSSHQPDRYIQRFYVAYFLFFRVSGHQLDRYIQRFYVYVFIVLPSQ